MTVSVVIPAFNARDTVQAAVESAFRQTVPPLEVIVVDDASTDGTAETAQRLDDGDRRIRILRLEENGGVSAARNAGIEHARGEWIALLDADDTWFPEKLERQLAFASAHPDVDLVGAWFLEQFGQRTGTVRRELWWPSALLVKRSVFDRVRFDPEWRSSELPEFFSRFDERFSRGGVEAPLLRYRLNTTGIAHRAFVAERMAWLLIGENRRRRRAGLDEISFSDLHRWFETSHSAAQRMVLRNRWRGQRLLRSAALAATEHRVVPAVALGAFGFLMSPGALLRQWRRLLSVGRASGRSRRERS